MHTIDSRIQLIEIETTSLVSDSRFHNGSYFQLYFSSFMSEFLYVRTKKSPFYWHIIKPTKVPEKTKLVIFIYKLMACIIFFK